MDDLLSDFIAETRETAEAIAEEIVLWEADPTDRTRLDAIFRFVHTVKGSCGFLDLPQLERLSHAAEDALSAVRAGERTADARLVSAVLAVIDRIGEHVDAIEAREPIPEQGDAGLMAALDPNATGPVTLATTAPAAPRVLARSIRVPVDLLDRMMTGVSDLVLARNELARGLRGGAESGGVDIGFERLSSSIAEMRETITRTRMARIDHLFSALPRLVRDLSADLGKRVTLAVDGGDVELDREMIEMVRDPLTHIVRNAIDHGVEPPADRVLAGKPAAGSLCVAARQAGNQIVIEVRDDGRGIDPVKLVDKAVASGMMSAEEAARLTRDESLELIFRPGFSTARAVSAVSGRGVGMDVVRANVERIGGQVGIDSRPGEGLRVTLCVPMTLTIIPALTVSAAGQPFAIPRSAIEEIVRTANGAVRIERGCGLAMATIRGERLPLVTLSELLGQPPASADPAILVVLRPGGRYVLGVDAAHDHEELVVKPASPAVMAIGIYAGATLPDDNRPMLLLDAAGIGAKMGIEAGQAIAAPEEGTERIETAPTLLFRDLDGAERAIRLSVVERIDDVARDACRFVAGQMRLVQDGAVLPLLSATATLPDQPKLRVLRIGDGASRLAYAIDHVIDIVALSDTVTPTAAPGLVAGITLVGERPVELVDPHWMLAATAGAQAATGKRPIALLVGRDDNWMREILRPLVEAAGYGVAFADSADASRAQIVIADGEAAPETPGVATLRLRAEPTGGEGVWRYDRPALMQALNGARGGLRA